MNGKNLKEILLNTRIFTCISICEKGIYDSFKKDVQRGINIQMQAFDNSLNQKINFQDNRGGA